VVNDGRLGAGVGLNHFFTRYFGIGGDAYTENTGHRFVDNASGKFIGRFPIESIHLAPYVYGGGRRCGNTEWGSENQAEKDLAGKVGGGAGSADFSLVDLGDSARLLLMFSPQRRGPFADQAQDARPDSFGQTDPRDGHRSPDGFSPPRVRPTGMRADLLRLQNFAFHGVPGAGASLQDMAKMRVYLKRAQDFPQCRVICERRFGRWV
jgi:hypothetical protein